MERLQQGTCTIRQGFVFNDLLSSIERVGDHCSNIALAVIELAEDNFDTHAGQQRLVESDPQAFRSAFDEYAARFNFEA